jgi:NADH-quinone oxidoreductase subunit L
MAATMLLLAQGGQDAVTAVAESGGGHAFEPLLPGLIVLLPLIGFLINGTLALAHARKSANAVRVGEEYDPFGGASAGGGRDLTHTLPSWIGPGVMLAAFVLVVANFARMFGADLHDPAIIEYWSWMATGTLEVNAALQLDQLSMIMMLVITGVGFLIHVFSVGYMKDDVGYPRYFAYLNLFVFFMLVLVMGASLPVMFVGWEGVGLCSYLLIGFWFGDREKSDAGKKAFIVNRIGDFGLLVAMFLLFTVFGTLDFAAISGGAEGALVYGGAMVTAITLFMLLGAAGKSAQIPLYVWLPDAMAGPTPVSALIHAATMVTAGIYLVARTSVLFALSPVGSVTVAGIGAATALFAATIALVQTDIKKVLAYSTVSQLGYMFLGVGVGAYAAGVFHLMTHAFFKALLFLGSGAVIHSMHHAYHATHSHEDAQDMRNMGGLRKYMPWTAAFMWIATLAIAGIWPFAGFFSKDEIIWYAGAAAVGPFAPLYTVFWVVALAAAMLTAFYMSRMMVLTFHGANRTGEDEKGHLHEAPWTMTVPLSILAFLSIFGGWINVPEKIRTSFLGGGGALPMSEWLHDWLDPVVHAAVVVREEALVAAGALAGQEHHYGFLEQAPFGGGELTWALISTVAAAAVVAGTIFLGARWAIKPARESAPPTGFRKVLYDKWYVDELYDAVIVKPILGTSRFLWRWVDGGIDFVVRGAGAMTKGVGWVGSLVQTGSVNMYAFVLTAGVLVILWFTRF